MRVVTTSYQFGGKSMETIHLFFRFEPPVFIIVKTFFFYELTVIIGDCHI